MKRSLILGLSALLSLSAVAARAQQEILNASYDVGRELFADVNKAFVPVYKAAGGGDVVIKQSHAGSSRQARSILEGLKADVVTFNQVGDVQILADGKLVAKNWASAFANNSSPFGDAYLPGRLANSLLKS